MKETDISKIDLKNLIHEQEPIFLYTCAILSKIRVLVELSSIDSEVSKEEVRTIRETFIQSRIEKLNEWEEDLSSDLVDIFRETIDRSFQIAVVDHGDDKIDCKEEFKRIKSFISHKTREEFYLFLVDFIGVDEVIHPNELEFLEVAKKELEI